MNTMYLPCFLILGGSISWVWCYVYEGDLCCTYRTELQHVHYLILDNNGNDDDTSLCKILGRMLVFLDLLELAAAGWFRFQLGS